MQTAIHTQHLFPLLDDHLITLLKSLTKDDWGRPTVAKAWTVKDVAAHLLHGNIRTLSASRDGHVGTRVRLSTFQEIVDFINEDNAGWVSAWNNASPQLLTELLEYTGRAFCDYMAGIDPFAPSAVAVAWAGETESPTWFHVAREYTEKWHHQQQIREAVGRSGIMTRELYGPCLETFVRALPHTYRDVNSPVGTLVQLTITGPGGGDWWLIKRECWELTLPSQHKPSAHTIIDGATAWKLFTKSWRRHDAANHVHISGDIQLGDVVLDMISVMA